MRILAVANQKGGCGKTTTAINLAASLAINGKKVLLIDLDPQAHATMGLGVESELNIYNVLSRITHKKAKLENITKNISPNFDVAPSGIILSILEQELTDEIGRESRLSETLTNFVNRSYYDYVLIDCPPNLGLLTINAIRACSEMVIPVEASRFSVDGISRLIDIIDLVKDRLNHSVDYQILVTLFDSRLKHSFKMLDRIKNTFGKKVVNNIIHVNVKLKEAQNAGTHIFGYDKYSRGAKDYYSLARQMITSFEAPAQEARFEAKPKPEAKKDVVKPGKVAQEMRKLTREETNRLNEIIFSISAPAASRVYVVGDFNGWALNDSSLMESRNGNWTKKVALPSGKYQYRFVLDDTWVEDPSNNLKVLNPFGDANSLLEV